LKKNLPHVFVLSLSNRSFYFGQSESAAQEIGHCSPRAHLYMQLAKIFTITRNPAAPYNIVQVRVFFPLNIDLGPAMHLTVEKGCQVDVSCLNIGHLH
jgi:hypothetical protein